MTPYSVSPRWNDQRVGPKPTKYRVTFIPNALAVHHVPGLVQADRDQDAQGEERRSRAGTPSSSFRRIRDRSRCACARAHDSAASTSSTVPGSSKSGASSSTRATVSTMPRNGSRPAVNAGHTLLVRRVVDRRPAAPGPPGRLGQRAPPGTPRRRAGANSQVCAVRPVDRRRGVGHPVRPAQRQRDRQPHVRRAGLGDASSRRRTRPSSGSPTAGAPSPRCRRTARRTARAPRSPPAPLFTSVAELIVTTGPMFQVGWASACSGRDLGQLSRRRPRNGPPLAVRISRRTSAAAPAAQALGQRRVLGVDRHDLPRPRHRGLHQRAAGDQRLLVGQREGAPGRAARPASAPGPSEPTTPLSTTSHGHCGQLGHRLRAGQDLRDA